MDTERKCGCKGRRTCLFCEQEYKLIPDFSLRNINKSKTYVYCNKCQAAFPGWSEQDNQHPHEASLEAIPFPGVLVLEDFLTNTEADALLRNIDHVPWEISQSGRRKQNYGPKCNFKKRKLSKGNFCGFPEFSLFVQEKFKQVAFLKDYIVIEQCSLEYDPQTGASIDPHVDDCWVWGERIVTVNVLGDSYLSFRPFEPKGSRYNLDLVNEVSRPIGLDLDIVVRVFMPVRSLIVLYDEARYFWEHFILREDVTCRRVCLAYREFTKTFLNKSDSEGNEIIDIVMKNGKNV